MLFIIIKSFHICLSRLKSLKIEKKLRLKVKCKCDRSEDGEDEEQAVVKESSGDDEKKTEALAVEGNDENSLTRTSCHDSGIDIRDALPSVPIIPTKKVNLERFQ
jgi:hypothetical protein